jgi:protein-tyrosine phosphatase
LFVCTGNICRSPTAERLLRHALRERLGDDADLFEVTSAGTGALVDSPIQEHAAGLLAEHGIDAAGFSARQLDADLLADADLMLGLTRDHRAAAATEAPAAIRKLFTLREFARLAEAAAREVSPSLPPVERARALVQAAARQRGMVRPGQRADDDVPDPYGRPSGAYRLPFALISAAVEDIADLLVSERAAPAES